ncbi:MAG: hypothetical protein RIF32_08590 [Leptospirales bacterium]|jgi:hypothetical protein
MAEGLQCRLCLHEFPGRADKNHIDLFVRAAYRIAALDTFEISAEFLPALSRHIERRGAPPESAGAGAGALAEGRDQNPKAALRLRIVAGIPDGHTEPNDSVRAAGGELIWRAIRKADHRLKYWNHSGPIEPAGTDGGDRGRLRELARGRLEGALPSASEAGFQFQLEAV